VRDTGWSVAGVSSAMTIGFLAMAVCSMAWGTLSDRWGPRPVVLTGAHDHGAAGGVAGLGS
jgi:MFS family permease